MVARASNTPVSNARVVAASRLRAFRAETTTGEEGNYIFRSVPSATDYQISIAAPPFQTAVRDGISAGSTVDVALELEPLRQSVTVRGEPAPVIASGVDTRELHELPSNGRNVNRFALLDPHVRNSAGLGSDGIVGARLAVDAGSFRHTYYVLDGASNYESAFANGPQQAIPLSAVAEVKVATQRFSAEYGGTSSGVIQVSTKSGSARFHGEAAGYLRPSGLQAAPPVSSRRLPNELRQAAASLGGPLASRTRFFASYEQSRQARGSFIQSPAASTFVGNVEEWFGVARLDHSFSRGGALSLRLNGAHAYNTNFNDRIGGFTQPSAAQWNASQSAGAQLSAWSSLAGMANELRAAYANAVPYAQAANTPQVSIVRPSYATEGGSARTALRTQDYQLADNAGFERSGHSIRFGANFSRVKVRDFSTATFGEYRFAPGPPRPGDQPLQYSQTFGTGFIRYGETLGAGFVQDEWRAVPRVTLTLGLRYEFQSITQDRNNFAPRSSIAIDLDGKGRTVLRAGAGIFYDEYYMYMTRRFFLEGPHSPTASYTLPFGAPGFPVFPASLANPPAGASVDRRDLYLAPARILNPYSAQFSAGVERALGDDWSVTVNGSHSHTLRQMRIRDANAPAPFLRTAPGQRRPAGAADATRPMTSFDGVAVRNANIVENSGASLYDALDLGLRKRFAHRHQFEAHYVYASSATYSMFFGEPNTGIPNDWGNTGAAERGPSDFYQRHRLVTRGIAELPFGLELSLAGLLASGLPVNPLTGVDNNGDTQFADRPAGFGRNSFRAPVEASLDASLSREFALRERVKLAARAEGFNLLNRSNYVKVNGTYGDGAAPAASFLQPIAGVANVNPARQFQFALRISF